MHRVLLALAAIFGAAGCSTTPYLSNRSINYNDAVETDANIGVLKNAVRASLSMPLTYTSIQSLAYEGRMKGSAMADVTLGDGSGETPLTFSVGEDDIAKINVNRLIGQEFYNEVLSGIKSEEFYSYWQQGWPRAFLFAMLVERIEIKEPLACSYKDASGFSDWQRKALTKVLEGKCVRSFENALDADSIAFDNDPDDPAEFFAYTAVASRLARDLRFGTPASGGPSKSELILPPVPAAEFAKYYEHLPEAVRLGDGYKIETAPDGRIQVAKVAKPKERKPQLTTEISGCEPSAFSVDGDSTERSCVSLVLRSPDAVAYYLGELLRAQGIGRPMSEVCTKISKLTGASDDCLKADRLFLSTEGYDFDEPDRDRSVIFWLEEGWHGVAPFVRRKSHLGYFEFRHLGDRYAVPREPTERGRTMQAVTLILQLLGVRQNKAETPQVNTLEVRNLN